MRLLVERLQEVNVRDVEVSVEYRVKVHVGQVYLAVFLGHAGILNHPVERLHLPARCTCQADNRTWPMGLLS